MALEPYLGSNNYQTQNQVRQELAQSPSSSILHQDGNISQTRGSSLSDSPGNLSRSVAQPYTTMSAMSNDSSLITESNSSISGASYMPNAVNNSADSLTSNYVRLSGSSAGDDLSAQQQIYQAEQASARWFKRQGEPLGYTVPLSQLTMPTNQAAGPSVMNSKKPRLEIKPEDSPFSQSIWLQLRSPNPMQSYNPEIAAIPLQHHVLQNQLENQTPMSFCNPQRPYIQPLPPQQPSRDLQKQRAEFASLSGSMCLRRLLYYMGHQRTRPLDNDIDYWRQFVEEYYSPCAKKRWCLSNYDNVGRHAQGVFSQPLMDAWNCDLCGSKSRKGFEATYDVLPRLNKIYYDSGITEEFLHLESPKERYLPSGSLMLTFGKAVQQNVYKDFRVVHEGQLRIIFSQELKITSWEFCVKSHEEFIPRKLVAAQVSELVENVARFQGNIDAKGTDGVPTQDLLTNCNKLAAAGSSLARKLKLPLVNDLGFSKQLVRCLQISEVFNCMEDLMGYSQSHYISPIESLKRYPQEHAYAKFNTSPNTQFPDWSNFIHPSVIINSYNNFHVPNLMIQTPIIGREQAISSMNYYQKPMMDQPDVHPSFSGKAPFHSVPQESPLDDTTQVINNMLEMLHAEQAKPEKKSKQGKGKTRVVYDPKVEGSQSMLSGVEVRAPRPTPYTFGGMVAKGNGSGSSSRTFPGHEFPKKELIPEEEFASTAATYPRFYEKGLR